MSSFMPSFISVFQPPQADPFAAPLIPSPMTASDIGAAVRVSRNPRLRRQSGEPRGKALNRRPGARPAGSGERYAGPCERQAGARSSGNAATGQYHGRLLPVGCKSNHWARGAAHGERGTEQAARGTVMIAAVADVGPSRSLFPGADRHSVGNPSGTADYTISIPY
jgi:hypothetical protein